MAVECQNGGGGGEMEQGGCGCFYLSKFTLYETRANFYVLGRDRTKTFWRLLKISRLETSELDISEDATTYSFRECNDLLKTIHEGNKSTGGLKFVSHCYGIIGFIKFLGPYHMLLITKRRKIGTICGHTIYTISKSELITLPHSSLLSDISNFKNENRYKKLLSTMDLTKDFFFSYSYHVMRSLQKNLCDRQSAQCVYETLFVWNEFLTRGIRNHVSSTFWTVALVHGFFRQEKLSIYGKEFTLTLIARRSRHYAGTRYLKRGVNKKGRVANDVETEQIVFQDNLDGYPRQIASVVQNRGSIPLFWSQENSWLSIKPDIILQRMDQNYEATRLHFENLVKRYGNPIIILNLIKAHERKPRESILRAEFANAIDNINKELSEENRLRFLHWDLSNCSKRKNPDVLEYLGKVAAYALSLTGIFTCRVSPDLIIRDDLKRPLLKKSNDCSCENQIKNSIEVSEDINISSDGSKENDNKLHCNCFIENSMLQRGVLRTNCIDCLDRTNVAQYAYGLASLGRQLYALGLIDEPSLDLDTPLADDLMSIYQTMGDVLALQYGGSAAHSKIFSERRGQWKAATRSQELFRTLHRYYSNTCVDAEKQDAINLFLGHFQPQQGRAALWELNSDNYCNVGRKDNPLNSGNLRSVIRRSLSDGSILSESLTPVSDTFIGEKGTFIPALLETTPEEEASRIQTDFTPEMSTCESDISYSRYTPTMPGRRLFLDGGHISSSEYVADGSDCSNFLDFDWLSSSGNSYEDDPCERSSLFSSPAQLSNENMFGILPGDATHLANAGSSNTGADTNERDIGVDTASAFSEHFSNWVAYGGTFFTVGGKVH